MNIRRLAILAAAGTILSPAISNASSEKTALTTCAHAFASSLAAPGAAAPAFRLVDRTSPALGSVAEYFAREYTFDLRANDRKTGMPVARASCSTDVHGAVIGLSPVSLSAPRTEVDAAYWQ